MKVFVSADIEGVAGISSWDETYHTKPEYAYFKEQMTAEVAAACEGAVEAGATEILVKDAHGPARNVIPSRLPECARISRGWSGHPYFMMDEIDGTYTAAVMIGYHSRAGSLGSPMAHTMSSSTIALLRLNGTPISEFTLNAMTAQSVGVPVVFVSGDELLCEDIAAYCDAIETVATQRGHGRSTVSIHPQLACRRISAGVGKALTGDPTRCLRALPDRFAVDIEYHDSCTAYGKSFYPGARLEEDRRVLFETDDYFEVLRLIAFAL
jgi:D-amino peptidase